MNGSAAISAGDTKFKLRRHDIEATLQKTDIFKGIPPNCSLLVYP
jgi:hypothetical protein